MEFQIHRVWDITLPTALVHKGVLLNQHSYYYYGITFPPLTLSSKPKKIDHHRSGW